MLRPFQPALLSFVLIVLAMNSQIANEAKASNAEPPSAYKDYVDLCKKEAGLKIHQTVENVEGLIIPYGLVGPGPYAWGLVKEGYKFIEHNVGSPTRFHKGYYQQGKGFYRHTLEEPGNPKCKYFDDTLQPMARTNGIDLHKLYGGKCLATDRIEEPSTPYAFFRKVTLVKKGINNPNEEERLKRRPKPGDIVRHRWLYSTRNQKTIFAEYNAFEYVPTKVEGKKIKFEQRRCGGNKSEPLAPPLPSEVLKPKPGKTAKPYIVPWGKRSSEQKQVTVLFLPPPNTRLMEQLISVRPPPLETQKAIKEAEKNFIDLCEKYNGPHIYEIVKDVRGVYISKPLSHCSSCDGYLLNDKFEFIEFRVPKITNIERSNYGKNFEIYRNVEDPGLYRFTLEQYDHPQCKAFYKKLRLNKVLKQKHPNKPWPPKHYQGKCIAAWKIDNPTAKYRIDEKWSLAPTNDQVRQRHTTFTSFDGKKLYAEDYQFTFITSKGPTSLKSRNCYKYVGYRGASPPRPYEVFIPKKRPIVFDYVGKAHVIDGDTIRIKDKELDLWAIALREKTQQCWLNGVTRKDRKEAKETLEKIIKDKTVSCRDFGIDIRDRTFGKCHVDNEDISSILVKKGMVFARGYYGQEEKWAKENKIGMWKCRLSKGRNITYTHKKP